MSFGDLQITHLAGLLHAALVSDRTEFTEGKYITWTARVRECSIVIVTGGVRSLVVTGTTATVTVVPAVTTYAEIAADWAADADAAALAYIGGDAGTVAAGYTGATLNIGTYVGSVRKAPVALGSADGEFPVLAVYRQRDETTGRVTARQTVTMLVPVEYYAGRQGSGTEEDEWGGLPAVVSRLRHVLQRRCLVTYPAGADAGKTLAQLADIETVALSAVDYSPALPDGDQAGPYPAFRLLVTATYQDQGWAGKGTLVRIDLEHNEPVAHQVPKTSQGAPVSSKIT